MSRLEVLAASGSPEEIGASHGTRFADQIRTYLTSRIALSREGTDLDRDGIVDIAERMLPAHEAYDKALFIEMCAMADASGITPAEAVIVGGYTDFIDTVRAVAHGTAVEDNCTAVLTPDAASDGAGFLAQTWDMHASATPHVFIFDIRPSDGPHALIFTTHGTVGQIGMNEAGVAVGINNLTVSDGTVGVTWPFAVRKALRSTTADDAIHAILSADLAGGHNYLVIDADGKGASIEATPSASSVETLADRPLVHTNHCLAPETQAVEGPRPEPLQRSSTDRLTHSLELLAPVARHTPDTLMALLRDERSICRRPEPPFSYESSGAVVMRPRTGDLWACWGVPSDNEFEHFGM